jgi:hypothetical protein
LVPLQYSAMKLLLRCCWAFGGLDATLALTVMQLILAPGWVTG